MFLSLDHKDKKDEHIEKKWKSLICLKPDFDDLSPVSLKSETFVHIHGIS